MICGKKNGCVNTGNLKKPNKQQKHSLKNALKTNAQCSSIQAMIETDCI